MNEPTTRRGFLAAVPLAAAWALARGDIARGGPAPPAGSGLHSGSGPVSPVMSHSMGTMPASGRSPGTLVEHPEPRPGIDASLVLTPGDLEGYGQEVQEIFAMIREIPEVADGIGCYCGCVRLPSYRSLLTCYYADGLARGCLICQGEAKLVYRRFKEGQSLDQIRRAVDARFA